MPEIDSRDEKVLAKVAYDAYREHAGGKSLVTGDPLPAFKHLSFEIQVAWIAVARSVATCVRSERHE